MMTEGTTELVSGASQMYFRPLVVIRHGRLITGVRSPR